MPIYPGDMFGVNFEDIPYFFHTICYIEDDYEQATSGNNKETLQP